MADTTTGNTTTPPPPPTPTTAVNDITKTGNPNDIDEATRGMYEEAKARYELYLQTKNDNLIRVDITAGLLQDWPLWQRADFLTALPDNTTIKTIHLSGQNLETVLTQSQIEELITHGIASLKHLEEMFVFQGDCPYLTEEILAKCLERAIHVKVLMLWQFRDLGNHPQLAGAIRMHPSLERVTINLPTDSTTLEYGCFDLYAMAMAGMPNLKVLQVRCDTKHGQQHEAIISPEGMTVLMNSKSIQSLYLENVGLVDDHVDAIAEELVMLKNKTLKSLDLKDNLFTDDVLYTFGQMLPKNTALESLDLSGVNITPEGGRALAKGVLHQNFTLRHLELEGVYENYVNEFDIPDGHKYDDWMQDLQYQLRLNRAYAAAGGHKAVQQYRRRFVEAISHVSDNVACMYYLLRTHTKLYAEHMNPISTWKPPTQTSE